MAGEAGKMGGDNILDSLLEIPSTGGEGIISGV
jgi:hypothetical protein